MTVRPRVPHDEMSVEITVALEYGTDRPVRIGRLELEDGYVVLALRYEDDGSEWFPTWVGPKGGRAVQLPRGFALPPEMLEALHA